MSFAAHEEVDDDDGTGPPIRDLSVEFVQSIARQYRELRNINLSYNEISDAVNLRLLPSLQAVDLSHNQLAYLPNLNLPRLRSLNLADNCIFYAEALSRLPELELVDLRRNNITSCQSVAGLADLPRLRELWLEGNPVASAPDYRIATLSLLPTLRTLDGAQVTAGERRHASTFSDFDNTANNYGMDASSVSLRPSIETSERSGQRGEPRSRAHSHRHDAVADHDSDEDSIGTRPGLGNFDHDADSRASKVIQRTRQLLDQAKQSREKAYAAAARISSQQQPPSDGRHAVANPRAVRQPQRQKDTGGALETTTGRAGRTLQTATRGLIASRRFSGGTSPVLPPMWNEPDVDSDGSIGQSDGGDDDALGPPGESPSSTDDERGAGAKNQVVGGPRMASAAAAIKWKVEALSKDRKIRDLEARVTEERLAADRMRKYFDQQALDAFQDTVHAQQQSSRSRQQSTREAQTVADLRRQLASARRQIAAQEQEAGDLQPQSAGIGPTKSSGDSEAGSLDRVLSSPAAAASAQALLLHTWRQQVFKLLVQQESDALTADTQLSEAKATIAQMTRSLDSSAKSNEVLRSKLEARTVELERRTEDLRQLRGVAADAALGASQSRGLRQQQLSSVRTGLSSLEKAMEKEEGRVAQAFRKLLVFDKRVGFASSRVRMLASVLKTRLRSAALRGTPHFNAGERMDNPRMLLDQQAPAAAIDSHLSSIEAGSLDIAAAQAISAECRSLRRERDFLLRSMQDMQQQQEATSRAAEELGSAAQQSLQREAKRRRELATQIDALQAKLKANEQNAAASVNRLKETWAQEEEGLRKLLAEQDSALAAAREENSSLRKAEAKQLFGIRQVERDLDRERRERDEEREEFAQQISTLQHSLSATRRQLNDIKRDRASLLAALRDTENLPKQVSSRNDKSSETGAPRSKNQRESSGNNKKRLLPRPTNTATLKARTSAQQLQERLSGLLELSSSLLRDGGDLDDEVGDSDTSDGSDSQHEHEAASDSSME